MVLLDLGAEKRVQILHDPPTAAEAVRGLRQGALPPDADPQGGAGATETLPDHARRGAGREVHADHHAPAGVHGQAFSGIVPPTDAPPPVYRAPTSRYNRFPGV